MKSPHQPKTPIAVFLNDFMEKILNGKIRTGYSHTTIILPTIIKMDCSGFVTHVLISTGRRAALREILHHKYIHQKTAANWNKAYVRNFVSALCDMNPKNWKVLTHPEDMQDGDIIFSVNAVGPTKNTNHCMFVRSVSALSDNTYKILVTDSTYRLIHYNDTRRNPGIGCGEVYITRTPSANIWICNYSEFVPAQNKKLVFARAI